MMLQNITGLGKIRILNRKKVDPENFIFTGSDDTDKTILQLFEYNETTIAEQPELDPDLVENYNQKAPNNWLNIYGLSNTELIARICKQQGIDNLIIQDILDVNQRPKFQAFENYYFLTIKTTVPNQGQHSTEQISFVFNQNYLISFQEKKADYFEHLRHRLRENKGLLRKKGPDFLLYTLLEAILDNYFRTLDDISKEVAQYNLADISTDPSPAILEDIERHKVFVRFIRNAIQPIKEFTLRNDHAEHLFIQKENLKYFQEIKDLCLTLNDHCDGIISSLESSINLFFSVQGHRMNQVMKTLTVVATIFIPLTFVAGVYGMNFKYMPETEWHYGYPAVWGLMFMMFLGMLLYFRVKKWF